MDVPDKLSCTFLRAPTPLESRMDSMRHRGVALESSPLADRLEEVKFHGSRAVGCCAQLLAAVFAGLIVVSGVAYVVHVGNMVIHGEGIPDADMEYGMLHHSDHDRIALVMFNESDFLHSDFLHAANKVWGAGTSSAGPVTWQKLDCHEHEEECKRQEEHTDRPRPDVVLLYKGSRTESWREDFLKAAGRSYPGDREQIIASLTTWIQLAGERAEAKHKEQEAERMKKYAGMGRHGGYPYGYGDFGGYGGYPGYPRHFEDGLDGAEEDEKAETAEEDVGTKADTAAEDEAKAEPIQD